MFWTGWDWRHIAKWTSTEECGTEVILLNYVKLVANFDIYTYVHIYKQIYILAKCYVVDFKYQYDRAKIINTEPHSLGKTVVANQCSKVIYCTNTITNTHHIFDVWMPSYILNLFQSNAKRCPNQEKMLSIWILTTSTDTWNKQFGATIDVR